MEKQIIWEGSLLVSMIVLFFLWNRKRNKKDPLYFDVNGKPAKLPTYLAHQYVNKDNHISLPSPPAKHSSKKKDDDWLFDLLLLGFLWNFFSSSSSSSQTEEHSSHDSFWDDHDEEYPWEHWEYDLDHDGYNDFL